MSVTRTAIESVMFGSGGGVTGDSGRIGALWAKTGLDAVTVDGTNGSLLGPMSDAARRIRLDLADFTTVTNTDLSALADADNYSMFLDLVEAYCYEKMLGNWGKVTQRDDMSQINYSDLGNQIEKTAIRKWAQIKQQWGIGRGTVTPGVLSLDFMETC